MKVKAARKSIIKRANPWLRCVNQSDEALKLVGARGVGGGVGGGWGGGGGGGGVCGGGWVGGGVGVWGVLWLLCGCWGVLFLHLSPSLTALISFFLPRPLVQNLTNPSLCFSKKELGQQLKGSELLTSDEVQGKGVPSNYHFVLHILREKLHDGQDLQKEQQTRSKRYLPIKKCN